MKSEKKELQLQNGIMDKDKFKKVIFFLISRMRILDDKYRSLVTKGWLDRVKNYHVLETICLVAVVYLAFINAWICDDAYHAFIMARNLVEGHGFVYNIGESVNASTCPFYTLIVAGFYAVYNDMFMCGVLSNMLFTAAASAILIFMVCRRKQVLIVVVTVLMCISRSFISYTTSGLENPMLFFLAAIFCSIIFNKEKFNLRELFFMAFIVGLIAGTRMDTVLIFIPICIALYFCGELTEVRWYKRWLAGIAGLLPFFIWLLFSVYYYGFPFPNTAYSKLNTGIPINDYLKRGFDYFMYSCKYDPVLLIIPALFVLLAFAVKCKKYILIAVGNLLYFIYVFRIGGDFMGGRHYTLIFFVSLMCCSDIIAKGLIDDKLIRIWSVLRELITGFVDVIWRVLFLPFDKSSERKTPSFLYTIAVVTVFLSMIHLGIEFYETHPAPDRGNIASDTREHYRPYSSLVQYLLEGEESIKNCYKQYKVTGEGGYLPFAPGFNLYYYRDGNNYFDEFGLGDSIIPRIQGRYNPKWLIGHVRRTVPVGYDETVKTGENHIADKDLATYYDKMKLIISGELNAPGRLETIIDFNLGKYDYLIDRYNENNANPKVYYITTETSWGY